MKLSYKKKYYKQIQMLIKVLVHGQLMEISRAIEKIDVFVHKANCQLSKHLKHILFFRHNIVLKANSNLLSQTQF